MTIHDKLHFLQQHLKAPKGQENSFGKYKYRSCEDILEALKPLLAINNLTVTISDKIVFIGGRHYIKATAFLSDGESELCSNAYAREDETQKGMTAGQLTGATSSYARKYALNGLLLIDDAKDDDTDERTREKKEADRKAERERIESEKAAHKEKVLKLYNDTLLKLEGLEAIEQAVKDYCDTLTNNLLAHGLQVEADDLQQKLKEKGAK